MTNYIIAIVAIICGILIIKKVAGCIFRVVSFIVLIVILAAAYYYFKADSSPQPDTEPTAQLIETTVF